MITARLEPHEHARAAALLRGGALVALPTETVYGLAARGLDEAAVRAIFAAKGRPADNPVILHVASLADALPLWTLDARTRARADALAAAYWPGPLTLVAHKSALVPDVVTAGLAKVAVRVPAHPAMLAVLRALGEPLAAPSANASGRPSPTSASDVLASLDGAIDAVLDGGACSVGIESTVVDIAGDAPVVLRAGAVTLAQVRAVLPDARALLTQDAALASPGLRHRHYRPAVARVLLVDDVAAHWGSDAALVLRATTAAALADRPRPRAALTEVMPDDAAGYARALYAALYRVERAASSVLVIERVPDDDDWRAVHDRVRRAAEVAD